MRIDTVRDLYIQQLRDLYSAETQLVKALPKLAKAATHPQLQQAFRDHLGQTEQQLERLEQIFAQLGVDAKGEPSKGMKGLIKQGLDLIDAEGASSAIDASLIAAAQRVEHYEIAGYGCVRTYAQQLGEQASVPVLQQSLDEECSTDARLTDLAWQVISLEVER
jgi:ferritin-like metal-binding protein YciE